MIKAPPEVNVQPVAQVVLQAVRLHPNAIVPRYANGPHLDNAMDLFVPESVTIRPGDTRVIGTGWKLVAPPGYGLFILPRSGLSLKTDLRIPNSPGLVDHGYRGEFGVLVWNKGDYSIHIKAGERIAQVVAIPLPTMEVLVVDEDQILGEDRGGGLGSTGV